MEVLGSKLLVGAPTLVPQRQQWRRKHSTHALTSCSPITLFPFRSSLRFAYKAASGEGEGRQLIKPTASVPANSFHATNQQKIIASIQTKSTSESKPEKPIASTQTNSYAESNPRKPIASIQTNSYVQSNPQKPFVPIQRKSFSASNPQEGNENTTNSNLNPIENFKKVVRAGILAITISLICLNAEAMLPRRPARVAWDSPFLSIWSNTFPIEEEVVEVVINIVVAEPKTVEDFKSMMLGSTRDVGIDNVFEACDFISHNEVGGLDWAWIRPQLCASLGRLEEAKEGFKLYLTLQEFNARALQGLAMVMHKQGEDAAMLEMLEESLQRAQKKQLEREADNIKLLLAYAYVLLDNLEEALKQYQCLADEKPKDFRPYLCQGILFTVLGKKDEAEEQFKKCCKLVPEHFPTHDFLDRVVMKAKTQGRKRHEERKKEEELLAQGKTPVRTMKQANIGGVIQDLYEKSNIDNTLDNKILDECVIKDLYENNMGEEIEDLPVFESNVDGDSKDLPESESNIDGNSKVLPESKKSKGKDAQDLLESERKG